MNENAKAGILLMLATTTIFAVQDAFSRHLASTYNVLTIVMIRYWFFAAFVILWAAMRPGGVRRVAKTAHPRLQVARGIVLVAETCVMVLSFTLLGLVESHAIFACYPLIVTALSGPVLGEKVGWRRRAMVGVGFLGVLIILRPGLRVFEPEALVALTAATLFATYGLMTRRVAGADSGETSLFYTGVAGAVAITLIAPFWWQPPQGAGDWAMMASVCVTGVLGNFTLIMAYKMAQASTVQPFAYFQLVLAAMIGVTVFGDVLELPVVVGAALVTGAGLFTIWRERVRGRRTAAASGVPSGAVTARK